MDNIQGVRGAPGNGHWDENFIHCRSAYDLPEVVFDWFQHWEDGSSGIYDWGTYSGILHTGDPGQSESYHSGYDCSRSPNPWVANYTVFNSLFAPPVGKP